MSHDPVTNFIVPLRLFAKTLCQSAKEADQLVKETLEAAIRRPHEAKLHNIQAHLLSIMRKLFYGSISNEFCKSSEPEDHLGCLCHAELPTIEATGEHRVEDAIRSLPIHLREAVVLVMVLKHSVDEAADVIGCDGDIISRRVERAKHLLQCRLL